MTKPGFRDDGSNYATRRLKIKYDMMRKSSWEKNSWCHLSSNERRPDFRCFPIFPLIPYVL